MDRCTPGAAFACALLWPAAASAQELPPDRPETAKQAEKDKTDQLILPIPISTPSLGTGAAIALVRIYDPGAGEEPQITALGAVLTSKGTKGVAGFASRTLPGGRFRVRGLAAYAEVRDRFWGIGGTAGDLDQTVALENQEIQVQLQGQMRIGGHAFAGVRYRLNDYHTTQDSPPADRPDLAIPADQLDSTVSAIGPTVSYDTRDHSLNPRSGVSLTGSWMFGVKPLGSSFAFDKLQLSASAYRPVGKDTVIAGRAYLCNVAGDVPYYELCSYGSGADLRGYEGGRYRDRAQWAVQAEIRQHLFGRFGAVAFAGVGGIAPALGDLADNGKFLPAAGFGVRYEAAPKNHVNLRLDIAFGSRGHAIYFGIGEAF